MKLLIVVLYSTISQLWTRQSWYHPQTGSR